MKNTLYWKHILLFSLSIFIFACSNNEAYPSVTAQSIEYLKENVDNPESIIFESMSWVMDEEGSIYFIFSYDINSISNEYLGYKKCIVTYNAEQDGLRPLLWYITFEDDTDEYAIVEALYNNALSNDKNENGVLSSQDIEEINFE